MSELLRRGSLEVLCGPMKASKTKHLVAMVDKFRWVKMLDPFIFIKPEIDNRSKKVRDDPLNFAKWNYIDPKDPKKLLEFQKYGVIAIDEVQFFDSKIIEAISELQRKGCYILTSGLDLDFRGEPFGPIPMLCAYANNVIKLTAVCDYPHCNASATRTQRLIDGKPAPYNAPIVAIEGSNNVYESRCLTHHEVPGKPYA